MSTSATDRRVIQIPVEPGLVCLRGLSPKRLRFEVEYGLERGTTANSFLFLASGEDPALLVHPPGNTFAEPYLAALAELVPSCRWWWATPTPTGCNCCGSWPSAGPTWN
jgi:flavorubredoxin